MFAGVLVVCAGGLPFLELAGGGPLSGIPMPRPHLPSELAVVLEKSLLAADATDTQLRSIRNSSTWRGRSAIASLSDVWYVGERFYFLLARI